MLISANNDAPVGIDGNSYKFTTPSKARAHGAVGSDLEQSLIVAVSDNNVALAIHGYPMRAVELCICAGAFRKPGKSGTLRACLESQGSTTFIQQESSQVVLFLLVRDVP